MLSCGKKTTITFIVDAHLQLCLFKHMPPFNRCATNIKLWGSREINVERQTNNTISDRISSCIIHVVDVS